MRIGAIHIVFYLNLRFPVWQELKICPEVYLYEIRRKMEKIRSDESNVHSLLFGLNQKNHENAFFMENNRIGCAMILGISVYYLNGIGEGICKTMSGCSQVICRPSCMN